MPVHFFHLIHKSGQLRKPRDSQPPRFSRPSEGLQLWNKTVFWRSRTSLNHRSSPAPERSVPLAWLGGRRLQICDLQDTPYVVGLPTHRSRTRDQVRERWGPLQALL